MASRPSTARPARWRPRLRTVLLTVNLLILLLPVGGIATLRLYENELIRSTEAQLIGQAALVREVYRQAYLASRPPDATPPGRALPESWSPTFDADGEVAPVPPTLDIARDRVLPPAAAARPAPAGPEPTAVAAGEKIGSILGATSRVTLAGIRVVDAAGVVVASSGGERGLSLAHREEVERALDGEDVSLLRQRVSDEAPPPLRSISRGQRYRVFVALPVVENRRMLGAVVVSRTPMDITKALYLNRRPLLLGAGALLAVVVLVSVLTSVTINRPVRALIRQADQVARGERTAHVEPGAASTRELVQLSDALSDMARTLGKRADYIRTFASHISHEFKTPLTTIRGTVELLQQRYDEMTPDERARFLSNLDQASSRLERLVRRLLEQARADALQPGDEKTEIVSAVDRAVRERGATVSVEHEDGPGRVRISGETLQEILSNLLDNARQHGGEQARVRIHTRRDPGARPPMVELTLTDDGRGISEANASRIFTPFFTTARDRGGSGLGLSIVRSLLEAHGGTIDLIGAEGPGACFRIRLPASD